MIAELEEQLTLRARAMSIVVATTAVTAIAATATGYTRSAGSFLADGFARGMEITPAGFATTTPQVITSVTTLAMTTTGARTAQAEAGGRQLIATLPSSWAWEGNGFTPTAGVPWAQEQFIGGPRFQATVGPGGSVENRPTYVIIVHVPINTGLTARKYADAVIAGFPPRLQLPTASGATLRVRSAPAAPYSGRLQPTQDGFQGITVTIPLWIRTANSI